MNKSVHPHFTRPKRLVHLSLRRVPLHPHGLHLGHLCGQFLNHRLGIWVGLAREEMSEVHDNNAAAHGGETAHDASNQIAVETAKGNDGRQQMLVLVDFDPRHVFRALFHVPAARAKGLATLADGRVVSEKQLSSVGDFLTLKERVEFRHRVVCLGNVFLFPRWDLDGPDMRFFGEWTPPADKIHPTTSLTAGPWVLDGRQMVADARDMTLMLAEAALAMHGPSSNVTLQILSPVPAQFEAQRGWKMNRGPFDAWWSGVRKAADTLAAVCPSLQLVAVSDTNPFADCTRPLHISWRAKADALGIVCTPCDPFALPGTSEAEQSALQTLGLSKSTLYPQLMMGIIANMIPVRVSTLVPSQRHMLWNPKARLAIFNPKPENKSK